MSDGRQWRERIRSEVSYSPLTREDLPRLARLIERTRHAGECTFVRDHTPAYYEWMYFRNPAGQAVVFAGEHNGELVTSFAVTPKRIQFGDEVVVCGKTMDMFTDPAYQGLGLISEVTSRVFREAQVRGIRMWYVTPSENSYPIFLNKWHYLENHRVNYIVRVLNYSAVFGAVVRPPVLGRVGGKIVDVGRRLCARAPSATPSFEFRNEPGFGPETDALWQKCRGYRVALVRDVAYLTWRYLENPDPYDVVKVYSGEMLRGILVTKFTRRRGLKVGEFVDWVAAPDDVEVRRAMYAFALRRFQVESCAFAQNWAIENSRWEAEMKSCGIVRRRRRVPVLLSPGAPRPDFYDPSAWLLTPGDGNDL